MSKRKLDVELDSQGKVVAIWFGCTALPFETVVTDGSRARQMRELTAGINKAAESGVDNPSDLFADRIATKVDQRKPAEDADKDLSATELIRKIQAMLGGF